MLNAYNINANNPADTGGGGSAPVAAFVLEGQPFFVNQPVVFDAATSTGENLTFKWYINGSYESSAIFWIRSFTNSGQLSVYLEVTNEFGTDTAPTQVTYIASGTPS